MFRPISATVLSFALLSGSALLAQSGTPQDGPPPPHEGMRHGGPGPFGMRGPGRHDGPGRLPAPIPNAPFSAQFTSASVMTDHEGKQVQHSGTSSVYRDSLGRTREEVTLPPPPPRAPATDGAQADAPKPPAGPRTMIVIFDPVANTITRLNPERKIASVQTVPADFFAHMQKRENREAQAAKPHGEDATVVDLGSKTFAGVVAQGKRITHSFPSREGEGTKTMTHESWFSPDLKLEVSDTETSDRGTHSELLSTLTKAEPDAGLFKVPEGYTVRNDQDRRFHGEGHRGPEGPPPAF